MKTLEQHYLSKLAEEATEIAQIALKTEQFGMDEKHPQLSQTNKERIHAELNDLLAVVDELNENYGLGFEPDWIAKLAKRQKMYDYLEYSQSLKRVEPYKDLEEK